MASNLGTPTNDFVEDLSAGGTSQTLTFSHTLAAGSNRMVVVEFQCFSSAETETYTVTFDGVALAQVNRVNITGLANWSQCQFRLLEADLPEDGAHDVVITAESIPGQYVAIAGVARSFQDIDQGAVVDSDTDQAGTGEAASLTLDSADGGLVIGSLGTYGITPSITGGQTANGSQDSPADTADVWCGYEAGTGSGVTVSWGWTGSREWGYTAFSVATAVVGSNIDVPSGAIDLVGHVPAIALGPLDITPDPGAITTAGHVPAPGTPENVPIPVGALTTEGLAPEPVLVLTPTDLPIALTIAVAEGVNLELTVEPPTGATTTEGAAPTVQTTEHAPVDVPVGATTVVGHVPTVQVGLDRNVAIDNGTIVTVGHTPTVVEDVEVAIPSGTITTVGHAPSPFAESPLDVAVAQGATDVTGYVPTITVGADRNITIPSGGVMLAGSVPFVPPSIASGEIVVLGYAPTPTVTGDLTVTIGTGTLVIVGYAATITGVGVFAPPGMGIRSPKAIAALRRALGNRGAMER